MLIAGLPVQVRDHALGMKDDVPKSDVNKEFYTQNVEKEVRTAIVDLIRCSCRGGERRGEEERRGSDKERPSVACKCQASKIWTQKTLSHRLTVS